MLNINNRRTKHYTYSYIHVRNIQNPNPTFICIRPHGSIEESKIETTV